MTLNTRALLSLALLAPMWACGDKDEDDTGSDAATDDTGEASGDDGGDDGGDDIIGEDAVDDLTLIDAEGDDASLSDHDGAVRLIVGTAAW